MQFTIKQYRKVIYVANEFYLTTNYSVESYIKALHTTSTVMSISS